MNAKLPTIAAVLALTVIGLSGCGSSSDAAADPGTSTPTHSMSMKQTMQPSRPASSTTKSTSSGGMGDMAMVDIKNFMYTGAMSVQPGQMIMVTNSDTEAHTLTSDDAGMFTVTVQPGATAMFDAPSRPGSYAYHCDFHANMHGSLTVS